MTPETPQPDQKSSEEVRVKAFRAEFERFKDQNRDLLKDPLDAALAERVARAFWNYALDWELRQLCRLRGVGLI